MGGKSLEGRQELDAVSRAIRAWLPLPLLCPRLTQKIRPARAAPNSKARRLVVHFAFFRNSCLCSSRRRPSDLMGSDHRSPGWDKPKEKDRPPTMITARALTSKN